MVLPKTMFFVTIRHVRPSEVVTVQVTVPMDSTVQDLRQRIHAETGVLPADQRVVFGGHLLSDEETLRDLGIGNDSTVFMSNTYLSLSLIWFRFLARVWTAGLLVLRLTTTLRPRII